MKTLPLLVCICALSACFKVTEGHRKKWDVYHKRNHDHRGHILYHQPPFDSQFRPGKTQNFHFIYHSRHYRPLHSKCSVKNKTVVENNTSEATTQVPFVNLTSNPSTEVKPTQNFVTTPARENTVTADLFAISSTQPPNIQTPQPSSASLEAVSPDVEQILSPIQNSFLQFLQYLNDIVKYLSDLIRSS